MNALVAKQISVADLNELIVQIETMVTENDPIDAQRVYESIDADKLTIAKAIRTALERRILNMDDNFRLVKLAAT